MMTNLILLGVIVIVVALVLLIIYKKKLKKYIIDEVERKISLHTYAKQDIKGVIENCVSSIDTKKIDDKLKEIFDAWIKESMADTQEMIRTNRWYSIKRDSFIKDSLSSILIEICNNMFEELKELNKFSNTEEFIDKVVERIQKKQITK